MDINRGQSGCASFSPAAPQLLRAPRRSRDGAMDMNMKKFTVRRFFSVYLRKKSRSKSSSLSRFEVKSALTLLNAANTVRSW